MARVYGYCDAGCRRRVPSYDEFNNIAAFVKVLPEENGEYKLDVSDTYLIKNPSVTDAWGFTIRAVTLSGGSNTIFPVELIAYDMFADGLKFRFLKILGNNAGGGVTNYRTKHEQNGTVSGVFQLGSVLKSDGYEGYLEVRSTSSEVVDGKTVYGELEIIKFNDDVKIEAMVRETTYTLAMEGTKIVLRGTDESESSISLPLAEEVSV